MKDIDMALKDQLHWRYATKSYNGHKVEQDKIDSILKPYAWPPAVLGCSLSRYG